MNNKDIKQRLCAELQAKVEHEYEKYMDSLYHLSFDSVIENSYKTVIMQEFKNLLENDAVDSMGVIELEKIIQIDDLLEKLYDEWLSFDSNETEIYKEFVFGYWDFS